MLLENEEHNNNAFLEFLTKITSYNSVRIIAAASSGVHYYVNPSQCKTCTSLLKLMDKVNVVTGFTDEEANVFVANLALKVPVNFNQSGQAAHLDFLQRIMKKLEQLEESVNRTSVSERKEKSSEYVSLRHSC